MSSLPDFLHIILFLKII